MAQTAVSVRLRAKLPRWYRPLLRALAFAEKRLGWKPSDATAERLVQWVMRRSDAEVIPARSPDQDNSSSGLDGLP